MTKKKRKLKKKSLIITIVAIILLVIGTIFFIKYLNSLKGKKINDYVYLYDIKKDSEHTVYIHLIGEDIYYFDEDSSVYTLYKRNIRSIRPSKIGTVDGKNDYCSFFNGYILCSKDDNETYYDYKLNVLYKREYIAYDKTRIVYHQGKILKVFDDKIYDGEKVIKELNFNDNDAYFYEDMVINNNGYIIYFSPQKEIYYYYDIVNDKYEKVDELLWASYNHGLYSTKMGEIISYDVVNNKLNRYTGMLYNNNIMATALKDNLFYFLNDDHKLYVMDLDKETITRFEYEFKDHLSLIYYDDNYIYLVGLIDESIVYVVDINNIPRITYTYKEYEKYMDEKVDKKVKDMEDKYHIDIIYKDEVKIKNSTFTANGELNDYSLLRALDEIDQSLTKFNTEFFDSLKDKKHKGLMIYLSSEIKGNPKVDTTPNASGYTLYENDQHEIVLDVNQTGIYATTCHELMHIMDAVIPTDFTNWFKLNPKGYVYEYSYRGDAPVKNTMYEDDKSKVYFVDTYAKSYPVEDRARIFENICSKDETTYLLEYPHLKEKALLIQKEIIKQFPSLKDAKVFDSLKETK